MTNQVDKISQKKGLPPGSLIHVGKVKTKSCVVTSITYNADFFEQKLHTDIEEIFPLKDTNLFNWINIDGLHIETIKKRDKN